MYYSLKSYTAQMQDEEADRKRFNRKVKCFSIISILLGLITLGSLVAFIVFISKNIRIFADDPVEYNLPKPSYNSWGFDEDNMRYDNWPSNDGNVKHMQQGPVKTEMMVETTTSSYDDYENEYGSYTTSTYDDYSNDYDSKEYDGDDYLHESSEETESQYYDKDPENYYDDGESDGNSEYDYTERNETDSQESVSSNEEPNYQYYNYPGYEYTETNESQSQDKETGQEKPNYQYNDYPYYDYTETNGTDDQDSVTSTKEPNLQYNDYPNYDYTEKDGTEGQGKVVSNEEPNYQYYDYPKYDNTEPNETDGQDKVTSYEEPSYQYYEYPKYDYTETNETDSQDKMNTEEPIYQNYDYPTYDYTETNETDGQDYAYSNGEPNYQYYDYPKYDYTETNEPDGQDNAYSNEEPNYQFNEYPQYTDYFYTEENETDAKVNSASEEQLVNADENYGDDGKPEAESNKVHRQLFKVHPYYKNGAFETAGPPEPTDIEGAEVPVKGTTENPVAKANHEVDKSPEDNDDGDSEEVAPEADVQDNISRDKDENSQNYGFPQPDHKEANITTIQTNKARGENPDSEPMPIASTFDYETGEVEQNYKDESEHTEASSKAYFQHMAEDEDGNVIQDKKEQQSNLFDTVTTRISADAITTPPQKIKEKPTTHQPLWKKLGYKK